jgi:hypothetical protein
MEGVMKLRNLALATIFSFAPAMAFAIGAIAVDDQVGESDPGYGFSHGYSNKEDAMKRALKECQKAGNANCKVKVWFAGCGAYAASFKYYGIGWGANQRTAESAALKQCNHRNCEIKVSQCDE